MIKITTAPGSTKTVLFSAVQDLSNHTEYLIMDYGVSLRFKYITFVLINKETFPDNTAYNKALSMQGTRITLLDDTDKEVYIACESLVVVVNKTNIDTIADQTYTIDLGRTVGRRVKFETDRISPSRIGKKIIVVESWAEVEEEIDPG